MNHRQRLESCLAGNKPDRPPVALWRHFPVDDQEPGSLTAATLAFQKSFDFDFVKVSPSSSFCLKDWGVEDEWVGSTEGTRDYTRRIIYEPEDWRKLPVLDPQNGYLGKQLECLGLLVAELGSETPVIQTIFNPLSQGKNLAGEQTLLTHLRRYPEAVKSGLEIIAESTRRFVEAAGKKGIAGIFYAVQHAQYGMLSVDEYQRFGRNFDLQVLQSAESFWLNVLHLHGDEVMFDQFLDYPIAVINWHDRETPPSLSEAQKRFEGVVCGGLGRWDPIIVGTSESVLKEANQAIQSTDGFRFILGTGCVVPIIAPYGNIMAARQAVGE